MYQNLMISQDIILIFILISYTDLLLLQADKKFILYHRCCILSKHFLAYDCCYYCSNRAFQRYDCSLLSQVVWGNLAMLPPEKHIYCLSIVIRLHGCQGALHNAFLNSFLTRMLESSGSLIQYVKKIISNHFNKASVHIQRNNSHFSRVLCTIISVISVLP